MRRCVGVMEKERERETDRQNVTERVKVDAVGLLQVFIFFFAQNVNFRNCDVKSFEKRQFFFIFLRFFN